MLLSMDVVSISKIERDFFEIDQVRTSFILSYIPFTCRFTKRSKKGSKNDPKKCAVGGKTIAVVEGSDWSFFSTPWIRAIFEYGLQALHGKLGLG